jgi:hypothetical protein
MAVASGILLGVFEGVGVLINRVFSEGTRAQLPPPRMLPRYLQLYLSTDEICSSRRSSCIFVYLDSCSRIDGLPFTVSVYICLIVLLTLLHIAMICSFASRPHSISVQITPS